MAEGENPTRRYKWFRPRQAARGSITLGNVTNYSTVALFNSSSGAHYLVIRDYETIFADPGGLTSIGYVQGQLGTAGGVKTPLVPGEAVPPGILTSLDSATLLTLDWPLPWMGGAMNNSSAWWPHNFPFAVLPPGWSFVLQDNAVGSGLAQLNVMWEAILADELDFAW